MNTDATTRTISALIGLSVFVVALVSGLAVENSGVTILTRAVVALVFGHALGTAVAAAGRVAIREYSHKYRANMPIDEEEMNELEARLAAPR